METLGQKLKNARLAAKRTASEAAKGTRIKIQHIEALEQDDFSAIPAPAYAKGFIRIYAEWLEIDPAPLIEEYVNQHAPIKRAPLVPNDKPSTRAARPVPRIPWPKPDWKKWKQRGIAAVGWLRSRAGEVRARWVAKRQEQRERIPPRRSPLEDKPSPPTLPPPTSTRLPIPRRFLFGGLAGVIIILVIAALWPRPDKVPTESPHPASEPPAATAPQPAPSWPVTVPEGTLPLLDALPPPYIDRENAS